ncbi:MAG: gliding motility-associated C-terminal domain-containing protein [Bacteroidota bacterium]
MKQILLISSLLYCFSGSSQISSGSRGQNASTDAGKSFDMQKAYEEAKAKGIKPSEIEGYVQSKKHEFSSKNALEKQPHKHTPYETGVTDVQETVIYLGSNPNTPQSVGCPNLGFEQYNFTGWTGGSGTVSTGTGGNPNYNVAGSVILNAAGNNVSVLNATNYQTIINIPATNPSYPTCAGYDSLAIRSSGAGQISDIPFVSPYSFDPVSVRLNSANANYRAARLKYITTVSSTNQRMSFSYAVILNDPVGHTQNETPYFKVEVKNEATGTILPGCTSYTFNPKTSSPADSLKTSNLTIYGDVIKYRKWQYYTVDLSTLPAGTNVSINFEVGGCSQGGHTGYAYVDAECGGLAIPYVNMCVGSTYATLVAPTGFETYQWFDPSNAPIAGAINDTLLVTGPTNGSVYTVQMVSPGGCLVTSTVSIIPTTVSIINLNSTSSCAGGNSGTAYVQAIGSSSGYTYMWTSTSGPNIGTVVGTTQNVTGLAPGTYSVVVTSPGCGQASANLSVGVTPASFSTQSRPFCGNSTFIPKPGGTNYQWYAGTTPIAGPVGTNDTLYVAVAVAGDIYNLTYTNGFGCRDSIQYTLTQIAGGSVYLTNQANVCPGASNGSVNINLSTTNPSPFIYSVKSSTATVLNSTTSSTNVAVSPLAQGSYTATVNDGVCIYVNTFTITPIQTNFTVTTTNTVLCFPTDTAKVSLNFGAGPPTSCGVDPGMCPTGNQTVLFPAGPFQQNGSTSYPTPYGNWYTYGRTQFLVQKADLNAAGITAGRISSLAFNILNLNGGTTTYPTFSIKMGCTSLTDLPNVSGGVGQSFITSNMYGVYSATNQNLSVGWQTYNFTQSFLWDGISNIIVETCFGMNSPSTYIANASVELKQMTYVTNMYHVEDATPVCGGTQIPDNGYGGRMANGANMLPNMKFGYCPYSPPASSYTVNVSGNGTIAYNYGNDSLKIVPTFVTPPANNLPITYTISVINPIGGCVASQTVAMLYPALVNSVTATPTQSTICIGNSVNLSSSGTIYYNWFYMQNGTAMPISTNPTITVTPPAAGTNTYLVTGTSPCPAPADTKTVTITVLPMANLLISPLQDITKCMDKPYVITTGVGSGTPSNAGTPYSYSWTTLPGNNPAPGANTSSSYTVNANSTTTLVLTVDGVCANQNKDTVVISNFVNDLAVSILDSSTTCANTPFVLNAAASGGYPNYTYGWFIDGNPNSLSNTSSLSFVSPGTQGQYNIGVYVSDSCGYNVVDYQTITVLPPCSVEIPNIITPNGDNANEFFKIKNIEYHPHTNVTIFDRWGRKVYENPNYNNEWKAEGVSDGTFFYVVDVPDDKKYSGFITVFKK